MTAACEVLLGWDGGAKLGEVIHCAPPYDKGGRAGALTSAGHSPSCRSGRWWAILMPAGPSGARAATALQRGVDKEVRADKNLGITRENMNHEAVPSRESSNIP